MTQVHAETVRRCCEAFEWGWELVPPTFGVWTQRAGKALRSFATQADPLEAVGVTE